MAVFYTNNFQEKVFEYLKEYDGKKCNLMVAGGSMLDLLNNKKIKNINTKLWQVFFCDERCDKNHLNFTQAKEFVSCLDLLCVVHPILSLEKYSNENKGIKTDAGKNAVEIDADKNAVEKYKNLLENNSMDLCLLGIGNNGHICSLWPNHKELNSSEYFIAVQVNDDIPRRLTVTLKYLNEKCKKIVFCVPPKNNIVKTVVAPHESISLKKEHDIILFSSNK